MHSLYLASIAFGIVSFGSGWYALRFPKFSEDRTVHMAFALICAFGAGMFTAIGCVVTR